MNPKVNPIAPELASHPSRYPSMIVLLPAYNEERTVGDVLAEFHSLVPHAFFVVVDNNSSDRTGDVARDALRRLDARGEVIRENRQGKGIAVRTALQSFAADLVILADADGTYAAADLPALIQPVLDGVADITVGDRISTASYARQNTRPLHEFGNRLVARLVGRLYGVPIRDVMSGYRVLSRGFAGSVPILHDGFELETEMTMFALDRRFRLLEVPIEYRPRPHESPSKLRTFRDGLRVLRLIFILFKDFKPLAFFSLGAFLFFLAGLAVGLPPVLEFIEFRYVYKVPSAILAVGFMLVGLILLTTGLILDTVVSADKRSFEQRIRDLNPRRM